MPVAIQVAAGWMRLLRFSPSSGLRPSSPPAGEKNAIRAGCAMFRKSNSTQGDMPRSLQGSSRVRCKAQCGTAVLSCSAAEFWLRCRRTVGGRCAEQNRIPPRSTGDCASAPAATSVIVPSRNTSVDLAPTCGLASPVAPCRARHSSRIWRLGLRREPPSICLNRPVPDPHRSRLRCGLSPAAAKFRQDVDTSSSRPRAACTVPGSPGPAAGRANFRRPAYPTGNRDKVVVFLRACGGA